MNDRDLQARARERTAGLRRLKRTTRLAALVTVALAGLFTAVAERSTAGHGSSGASNSTLQSSATKPGASSLAQAQGLAPTQQPPLAVSGAS